MSENNISAQRVTEFDTTRRAFLAASAAGALVVGGPTAQASDAAMFRKKSSPLAAVGEIPATWMTTTQARPWQPQHNHLDVVEPKIFTDFDAFILTDGGEQIIEGFGGCLSELGWKALQALPPKDRDAVLSELFLEGAGANFNICRMPIGANDCATSWYSHNEHSGDFGMTKFDIARDREMLIPFIKAAQGYRKDLRIWASPWSPPTWMKTNRHYAQAMPMAGMVPNGLKPDQVVHEGEDGFIQKPEYFRAYALYFRRFVEEYRKTGIPIFMVMPQNEFNSAQIFPSCCWSPEGLARFIPYLGKEMQTLGVDICFGTLERESDELFEKVYADQNARPYIKGIAAQWAGRKAIPFIHHAHPGLKVIQSEQECGNGANDWRFARYSWSLMKDFLRSGASIYDYWNTVMPAGGFSSWGWTQNSLVSVDLKQRSYTFNPDYYVFKHLSHFVRPGARKLATLSYAGYDNLLAFKNPDGRIVVIVQNDMLEPAPIHLTVGGFAGRTCRAELPADSLNTIVI